MAQFRYAQTSFSSGEISPEMYGRTDTTKHQTGLKTNYNAFISSFGGAVRRYGSRFVCTTKYQNKEVVLIKFVFSVDQSYMLEFGDKYIRFFTNGELIKDDDDQIYEIESPYFEINLPEIKYTQRENTLFLVHPDHPVYQLTRQNDVPWSLENDTRWKLEKVAFDPVPFEETTKTPYVYLKFTSQEKDQGKPFTVVLYEDEGNNKKSYKFTVKDIGGRITANSGVLEIDKVDDESPNNKGFFSTASGKIVYVLSSVISVIPGAWTLLHQGWNDELGYPSSTFIHQQRLIFAASKTFPRKIWMSTTGNPYNFDTADGSDSDALSVSIDDNQGNKIIHIAQNQVLLALTAGNEFSVTGGAETGIKPGNITIRLQSAFGSNNVRPVNIDASVFFVQRAGKQIKAVANSGYYGTDAEWSTVSEISKHLLDSAVKSMAYQHEPNSILWIVRGDGDIAQLTYKAEQEIAGWGHIKTEGEYLSVCCIPEGGQDTVYTAVKRNINGNEIVYIEIFDAALNVDCGITGISESGGEIWEGFNYLEGMEVDIVADGAVMKKQTVKNGKLIIDRPVHKIEVGLHYDTEIEPLFQDVQTATGSLVGSRVTLSEVTFSFHDTKGAEVELYGRNSEQIVTSRKFGRNLLDKPAPFVEPTVKISSLNWDVNDLNMKIKQTQPLPFHLMAVAYMVTSG